MSEVNACPSCGADASHRKTDDEQPSLIFCEQCGYVLQDSHFMLDRHIPRNPDPRPRVQFKRPRSMEKHITNTLKEIFRLAVTYHLTDEEIYAAKRYLSKYYETCRPPSYDITATALVYLVRKQSRRPIGLRTFAANAGIPLHQIGREYLKMVKVLHPNIPEDSWEPAIDLAGLAAKAYKYLGPLRNKEPAFSYQELLKLARRILDTAVASSYNTGRAVNSFVVACIVLASDVLSDTRVTGKRRRERLNDIGALTLTAGQSIEKRYTELGKLFRQKADALPWKVSSGNKCTDIVPVLLDILEFEESLQSSVTTAKVEEMKKSRQASLDSNFEGASSEMSNQPSGDSELATAISGPPSFLRAEIARKQTMAQLEKARKFDESLNENEEDPEVLQMIYLQDNGYSDEEIYLMTEKQRNALEDSLRFREQHFISQRDDLDDPHLDDEDLSFEEQKMYIIAPVSKRSIIGTKRTRAAINK
ncbi:hypothetical protein INT43_000989 [Umbelopsis isabellina]|uniref:TFIIB-type domain-containing protein n=1 Tax=Mortierella isabellina TaxID=91625 RepID=A0A8H7UGM9_MORIS|nr:hypothetical protein INT43_000989 [Umbelopsis isabellina]